MDSMEGDTNDKKLERATKTGIRSVGDARVKIAELEEKGIPLQHAEFLEMRDEIHNLLDLLLLEQKMDLETSHLVRSKLRRANELFKEMEKDGHYKIDGANKLAIDKSNQDSKLHVIQLILSQIFPKLKNSI